MFAANKFLLASSANKAHLYIIWTHLCVYLSSCLGREGDSIYFYCCVFLYLWVLLILVFLLLCSLESNHIHISVCVIRKILEVHSIIISYYSYIGGYLYNGCIMILWINKLFCFFNFQVFLGEIKLSSYTHKRELPIYCRIGIWDWKAKSKKW